MPRTLYAKLALVLAGLLILIGLVYAFLTIATTRHHQQQIQQKLNRDLARNLIADRNLVQEGRLNQEALKETFTHYMMVNPSIEIYLLDLHGTILSYSAEPGKVKLQRVSLGPIRDFLGGQTYPLLGDDPRSHDGSKIFSVAPVPSSSNPEGYLYVVLRGEEHDRIEQFIKNSYLFRLSANAVIGSLLFGLLAGLLLFHLLTRRLRRLSAMMNDFHQSNFTQHSRYGTPTRPADEIDQLGLNFDRMAERIREQLEDLKQQNTLRRELVANVSHDLRTPLATLRGYLETLKLKAGTLDNAAREEYVDTALRHSERLSTLVEDLLELAKLDAKAIEPHHEPFSLAELAQDVLQKFRLAAIEQGIALSMEDGNELPYVYADIGLIERVLENLVSNALQHTPENGTVRLALQALEDNRIEIRVSDSGYGISEEDLPHIFDRFYQAGNRHRSGHHSGLGLAIAKHIVALHGDNIRVSSRLNVGTTFAFSLPQWHNGG